MKIKVLREDKVLVELPEKEEKKKEAYKKTETGILMPEEEKKVSNDSQIVEGTVILVGKDEAVQDIKVGDKVTVKRFQGERMEESSRNYLFKGRDIIGINE